MPTNLKNVMFTSNFTSRVITNAFSIWLKTLKKYLLL